MKWKKMEMPSKLEIEKETLSNFYGKFMAEPFERGYGQTIGNSLRRILLSSIQTSAATAIKIENVLHEFGTIEGVVEDVTEIILNIKQLKIKLHGNAPKKIYLIAEGERVVKASDIKQDPEIEIANPDLIIANLTSSKAKFNMEILVDVGRGYATNEDNKKEDFPIGMIPIDSIFTPITKVNFNIDNTRVGQITDYEKLTLEIWTDGRIKPEEALSYASKILKDHLTVFVSVEEEIEIEEEVKVDTDKERLKELLKKSVDELELSVRSANCLKMAGIKTIIELVKKTEIDMLKYRNFGRKSLKEIGDMLKGMSLSLGMDIPSDVLSETSSLTSVEGKKKGKKNK
ncbi:MAG: DNA-directed RNA polymerase subunit alpha [Candidatus Firestonebacteria bacterium]